MRNAECALRMLNAEYPMLSDLTCPDIEHWELRITLGIEHSALSIGH
jgi:hypothetical protein